VSAAPALGTYNSSYATTSYFTLSQPDPYPIMYTRVLILVTLLYTIGVASTTAKLSDPASVVSTALATGTYNLSHDTTSYLTSLHQDSYSIYYFSNHFLTLLDFLSLYLTYTWVLILVTPFYTIAVASTINALTASVSVVSAAPGTYHFSLYLVYTLVLMLLTLLHTI
jgi:hypothetical protein